MGENLIIRFVALVAVVSVVISAGCGDSSEGDETQSTTADSAQRVFIPWGPEKVSKAEYVARSNGVCEESWIRMLDSYERRYRSASSGKPFAEATKNIFLPGVQFWFDDIAYLVPPPGEKAQVAAMLTAMQLAVFKGEEQPVTSPKQLSKIFSESNRLTKQNDLNSCVVNEGSLSS